MHAYRNCYSKELMNHENYVHSKRFKNIQPSDSKRELQETLFEFENRFPKKSKEELEDIDYIIKDSFEWELNEKEEHDQYIFSRDQLLKSLLKSYQKQDKHVKSKKDKEASKVDAQNFETKKGAGKTANKKQTDNKRKYGLRSEEELMIDILLSGTAATLMIQTPKKIYIGWIGDSMVALQGSEKNVHQQFTKSTDLFMTYPPHKPDLRTEKIRIYNKRGEIRESPLDGKSRIYIRGRMYPALSISRSIGDLISHQIGVTSEPEIRIHEILQHDKFFVLGSVSLWELLGPEEVIEIINENELKEYGSCSE